MRLAIIEDVFARARRALLPAGTIIAVCLAGCAVIPPPPSQLPVLAPAVTQFGVCPIIAGRYADRGSAFSKSGEFPGPVSLTGILHGRAAKSRGTNLHDADVVEVTSPVNDVLEFRSRLGGRVVAAVERRKAGQGWGDGGGPDNYFGNKGFVCLVLKTEQGGAPPVGMYAEEESLWLRKAVDGSLIVLHRKMGGGLLVILPFGSTRHVWYRFPPAELER